MAIKIGDPSIPVYGASAFNMFSGATMIILPGRVQSMGLGAYNASDPMPKFKVSYEPDIGDQMGASLERIDVPGKPRYVAVYQFHNFSEKPCQITVQPENPIPQPHH